MGKGDVMSIADWPPQPVRPYPGPGARQAGRPRQQLRGMLRLGERLSQAGLTPAGPATSYYEDVPDGDGVIVHAALPVNADPGSARGFEITDLPEITQAATIMHRGPMDNVMATIQTLARWIDENGYRSTGHVRELTLECPDDPDKWVTELQEPITPA